MVVDVDTKDSRGELLSQAAPSKPRYQTDVYIRQLDGIDSIVSQIIAANDAASSKLYARQ